jgi:hypothetical protein
MNAVAPAALLAAAVLIVALTATPALAGVKCKSASVTGAGLTSDQATSNWSSKVAHSYGSAWSNFGLARNKRESEQPLPDVTMYFMTATPCRRT